MKTTWMEKARISLAVVASVVGEKVNTNQAYVSCRVQLLAGHESLYSNAFRVLKARLTQAELESCRRRFVALTKTTDVETMAHRAMKDGVL